MKRDNPRRRILDTFGAGDEIAGIDIDYSLADLKLFLPAFAGALLWFTAFATQGGIIAISVGLTGGLSLLGVTGAIVFIAPSHMTPQTWLRQMITFSRRPKTLTLFGKRMAKRTEPLTRVQKFDPRTDTLERTDGTLVAGVQVDPANLTLATDTEWNAAADALGTALNTLEFDFQIRSTARRVDAEQLVAGYTDRLDDPDVQSNETLRELIKHYRERLPHDFQARGTSVREYQILIPVTVHEVQLAEHGALAKLADVPYLGTLFELVGAESTRMTDAELKTAQGRVIAERLRAVQDAIRGIETCRAEPITADLLSDWVDTYWTGTQSEFSSDSTRLRTKPVVTARTAVDTGLQSDRDEESDTIPESTPPTP
ncbi:hypothetical protein [Haladaptatus sp. NG-WS-4]